MAKDKDRTLNPAAAQRKLDKQKALKKGKAQVAAQRTERLAHRNPHRLESQIADLHALKESSGGKLSGRDAKQLEELERDVARVKKARESLGEGAPQFGQRGGRESERGSAEERSRGGRGGGRAGYSGLGKRRRGHDADGGGEQDTSESEETDEDVRRIPWPKDTPPPIPRPDRRRQQQQQQQQQHKAEEGTSANREPLGAERYPERSSNTTTADGEAHVPDTSLPPKPAAAAEPAAVKKTYESKAQVRDLRKEATARFVPSAVKRKIDATKGVGGRLLEEEEVSRLEKEGYGTLDEGSGGAGEEEVVVKEEGRDEEGEEERRLREEEEAFQRALGPGFEDNGGEGGVKRVEIEEVSDEDL